MAFVTDVELDHQEFPNPELEFVLDLVPKLTRGNVLCLHGPNGAVMYLAYCPPYGYFVSTMSDEMSQKNAVDMSVPSEEVLVCLGQEIPEERRCMVPIETALKAAAEFFATGGLAEAVVWMAPNDERLYE